MTAHPDHERNRIAWNEMAEVHYRHPKYKVKEFLDGVCTLRAIELDELGDVNGKSLLHLFCQFGLDTLSWARRGAAVTGVDISDRSIELADQIKTQAGIAADFIRSDVLDLVGKIDHQFDIVFQSYGTHDWISDLDKWAAVVAHHLKPGGVFYMVDFHPVAALWVDEAVSYFNRGPYRYVDNPDYCDRDYRVKSELVEWQHTLSDIVNALIRAALTINMLNEFDKSAYPHSEDWYEEDGFYYPPGGPPRHPLMFSLRATRA